MLRIDANTGPYANEKPPAGRHPRRGQHKEERKWFNSTITAADARISGADLVRLLDDPAAVYAELQACVQLLGETDDRHLRVRAISGARAMLRQLESAARNRAAT